MPTFLRHLLALPSRLAIGLIWIYQKTLSPDHGLMSVFFPYGACPQHPTCSEYAIQRLRNDGLMRGGAAAVRRVLSCHPWRKPDPERLMRL
jgi:putative membrane protein insertion efficiency factor